MLLALNGRWAGAIFRLGRPQLDEWDPIFGEVLFSCVVAYSAGLDGEGGKHDKASETAFRALERPEAKDDAEHDVGDDVVPTLQLDLFAYEASGCTSTP